MKNAHFKTLILALISFYTNAQEFDLNNFKYRYQEYYLLQANYDLTNKLSFKRLGIDHNYRPNTGGVSLNLAGSIAGYRVFNLDEKRLTESFNVRVGTYNIYERSISYGPNGDDWPNNPGLLVKDNIMNNICRADYSKNITKYYDKNFISYGYSGSFNFDKSNQKFKDSTLAISFSFQRLTLGGTIGIGRGRLEYVDDAVAAIFLLEDLQKTGMIDTYTDEQVENIAKGIVKARNTRFIGDSRFQVMDQIAIIDSVCKENQITAKDPLKFYSILYDNYYFNNSFFSRKTGRVIENYVSLDGDYQLLKTITTPDYEYKYKGVNTNLSYRFTYSNYKQKSQKTERGYSFGISASLRLDSTRYSTIQASGTYNYLIQPNSRTYLRLATSASIYRINFKDYALNQETLFFLTSNLRYNRFISRRASLYIDSNLDLSYSEQRRRQGFSVNYNINSGISYSFF